MKRIISIAISCLLIAPEAVAALAAKLPVPALS